MRVLPFLSAFFLLGCFGTEVPSRKPPEDPLAGMPPPKPTTDATLIQDKPNERKPSKPDDKLNREVINRATRQAGNCPQINTEGPFGEFTIVVVLSEKGKVADVRLPPELVDKPIGKCVQKAYIVESFPPWEGTPINESVKVELKKPEEPAPPPKDEKKKKLSLHTPITQARRHQPHRQPHPILKYSCRGTLFPLPAPLFARDTIDLHIPHLEHRCLQFICRWLQVCRHT